MKRTPRTITTGTSYFPSRGAAIRYYAEQHTDEEAVDRKLADGEIHIGKPFLREGEQLVMLDNFRRYGIQTTSE